MQYTRNNGLDNRVGYILSGVLDEALHYVAQCIFNIYIQSDLLSMLTPYVGPAETTKIYPLFFYFFFYYVMLKLHK